MQALTTLPDIEAFIFSEVISASGADPSDPNFDWNWSVKGVRRVCDLAFTLHDWIDRTIQTVGTALNELNPVNKLPTEILCIIFSLATAGDQAAMLRLSNVCKHWQDVSLGHPVLWSNVEVRASRYAQPDALLENLARQLVYTKDVPTDLELYWPSRQNTLPWTHMDPLQDHMFHLRSLDLRVPPAALEQQFRVAMTMPAPVLVSLTINVLSHSAVPFPSPDTFLGHSPSIRRLSLTGLALPPPAWPPLAGLTHLNLSLAEVALSDLATVIYACSGLQFLLITADSCVTASDWNPVPSVLHYPSGAPRISARLALPDATPAELQRFLSCAGHPAPSYLDIDWFGAMDAWAWMSESAADTTHARLLRDPIARHRCLRVTARDRAGNIRTTFLRNRQMWNPLLQTLTVFHSLRELVVSEHFWLPEHFPAVPTLETVTVVLDRPSLADDRPVEFVGIFLLPLDPEARWTLPALRTVRLRRSNLDLDDEPAEPDEATAALSASPLVVSAHDIAVFLTWHLVGPQPVDLILHDVVTYEDDDHHEMQFLRSVVASVNYDTGYEEEDPFSRENM